MQLYPPFLSAIERFDSSGIEEMKIGGGIGSSIDKLEEGRD